MRHVTFGKSAAPYGVGEKRLVPDDVAEQLQRDGMLSASEPWPPAADTAAAAQQSTTQKPARPVLQPRRPTGGHDRRTAK